MLDGTAAALLSASLVSIGGTLSELPFVAHGFWHDLPQAGDYQPLANLKGVDLDTNQLWTMVMGTNHRELALCSITVPCYFAVTMDAIALGRWVAPTRRMQIEQTSLKRKLLYSFQDDLSCRNNVNGRVGLLDFVGEMGHNAASGRNPGVVRG